MIFFRKNESGQLRKKISFSDLENRRFWCQLGDEKERAFAASMEKMQSPYSVSIHPHKISDPYHPDLLVSQFGNELSGEVKIKNSPLFIAKRYVFNPQFALTMDLKDSLNYSRLLDQSIDLLIFIWVKWEAHEMVTSSKFGSRSYSVEPMRGVWVTNFSKLRSKENSESPPLIHWYKERLRQPVI